MSGLDDLLTAAFAATVIGAASARFAPRGVRRLVFLSAVAIECLLALAVSVGVLAYGTQVHVPLWPLPLLGHPLLVVDPLAALFLAVTSLVFLIGSPFAARDVPSDRDRGRTELLRVLYQLLFGAILLVLAAGDVLSFLVGWEVMSLLLYGLIVLGRESADKTQASYLMLAMGEVGMIAGAAGLLLLATPASDLGFASLRTAAPGLGGGLIWVVFALTFLGFGVKAGLVPVNQWLPDAYALAPARFRPVFAGATTNLGIYAIERIDLDLLSPTTPGPGLVALFVGSLTALIGILYATIQPDLRRMLAHSTIENMGIVTAAIGAGMVFSAEGYTAIAAIAYVAALYHMTNHAFYKALLFTGAASIEQATATSDMDRLGGLLRYMPLTGFLFLVGILAIAALPPLNGFVSEWLTLETMLRAAVLSSTTAKTVFAISGAFLALTAGLAVTCFIKAFAMSFLGLPRSKHETAIREPSWSARGPMAAFAALCILLGVLPTFTIPVLDQTVAPFARGSAVDALVPPFFQVPATGGDGLSADFVGEFHDLGAQVGRDILPGRGLVVLHQGGERNPVVFAMSTTYMVAVLALLLALIYVAFGLVTRARKVTRRPAWDGGLRRLRPQFAYTATGFSNPVRVVFHALLRPTVVEETTEAVAEHFRTAVRREYAEVHIVDRLLTSPVVAGTRWLAQALSRMHVGHVNAYAAYVLLAVLAALVVADGSGILAHLMTDLGMSPR